LVVLSLIALTMNQKQWSKNAQAAERLSMGKCIPLTTGQAGANLDQLRVAGINLIALVTYAFNPTRN